MRIRCGFKPLEYRSDKIDYFKENRLIFALADAKIQDGSVSSDVDKNEENQIHDLALEIQKTHGGSWELALRTARAEILNKRQIEELAKSKRNEEEAIFLAKTDGLTGLNNKRQFEIELERELSRINRYEETLSIMMIDMDHFKWINDSLGHPVGDSALKILSRLILDTIRTEDIAARFGGEEFVVILVKTEESSIVAERLRAYIENEFQNQLFEVIREKHPEVYKKITDINHPDAVNFKKVVEGTISIGLAIVKGKNELNPPSLSKLVKKADDALYKAKENGRNMVAVVEGDEIVILNKEIHKNKLKNRLGELLNNLDKLKEKFKRESENLELSKEHKHKKLIEFNEECIANTNKEIGDTNEQIRLLMGQMEKIYNQIEKESLIAKEESAVA